MHGTTAPATIAGTVGNAHALKYTKVSAENVIVKAVGKPP